MTIFPSALALVALSALAFARQAGPVAPDGRRGFGARAELSEVLATVRSTRDAERALLAELDGLPVNKPGSHPAATAQLRMLRGRAVRFHTALCVMRLDPALSSEERVVTDVLYRMLGDDAIERYLQRERPYDCAGSAKVEGLGIALTEAVRGDDPTALIGLPLIALTRLLQGFGLHVL